MPLSHRRVSDPVALKVLAHPVRLALLDLLVAEGPATATQAAARVGASPSNCSWHLRLLARHGFVREARGGTGRNRPWQAVREGLGWDEGADPPTEDVGSALDDALTDLRVEQEVQRFRVARAARSTETDDWRAVGALTTARVWLTAEEAGALTAEVAALVARYADRADQPADRPAGSRPTALVSWLVPTAPSTTPSAGPA